MLLELQLTGTLTWVIRPVYPAALLFRYEKRFELKFQPSKKIKDTIHTSQLFLFFRISDICVNEQYIIFYHQQSPLPDYINLLESFIRLDNRQNSLINPQRRLLSFTAL